MFNPQLEIRAYELEDGQLAFGAATPEGVVWLEQNLKPGEWIEDESGRPLWAVGELEAGTVRYMPTPDEGPPSDAATATGMYDREEG